jgi:PRA1 family protein
MMESARVYVSSLASRMWGSISVETLRPLPMFLGISGNNFCMSAGAFAPPIKKVDKMAPEKITSRIKINISFFLTNYALVASGVAVVVALMHPGMLFSLGLVWLCWWGHNYLIHNEVVLFNHNISILVSISHRFYVLFVLTVIVVVSKCFRPAMIFLGITSSIIMAHAIMRDPKHIDKFGSGDGRHGGSSDSDDEEDNNGSAVLVSRPNSEREMGSEV